MDEFINSIKKQIEEFNINNADGFSTIKDMSLNDILTKTGKVYFIQAGVNGAIKIGYTDNVGKRLKQIQTGNPHKLNLLKVVNGGFDVESSIHKLFSEYRLEGEWFTPSREIMEYIDIDNNENNNNMDNFCDLEKHIINFCDKQLIINPNRYIESIKLYEAYKIFCMSNGIVDYLNNVNLGKYIKKVLPNFIKKQKKINGRPIWIYTNISLKNEVL